MGWNLEPYSSCMKLGFFPKGFFRVIDKGWLNGDPLLFALRLVSVAVFRLIELLDEAASRQSGFVR